MIDIIIVGAGPAGLTAAIYAGRANKKVVIFESKNYGGKIVNALKVENYPGFDNISGFELASNLYKQAEIYGAEIKYEKVEHIEDLGDTKKVITNKDEYICRAIIIANGVNERKINLPNEDKFLSKGISYCATCDGAFFKGKDVVVYGGGNTAVDDALFLADYCNKVILIYRKDKLRAEEKMVDKLVMTPNVEIMYNSVITSINGNERLESITINDKKELKCSGLFIAIGQVPNNNIFNDLIEIDNNGYIISDELCHTKTKGIYVAGDTRSKEYRQLTTATSDGTIAALTAIKELL